MDVKNQRRMAQDILDCGSDKAWIDNTRLDEVAQAITKADVRRLILKGFIKEKKTNLQSRARARLSESQKSKGRSRGPGKKKGTHYALMNKKQRWIKTIRPLRRRLKELRDFGIIDRTTYRHLYMMAKAGNFRSKSHLNLYIKEKNLKVQKDGKQ